MSLPLHYHLKYSLTAKNNFFIDIMPLKISKIHDSKTIILIKFDTNFTIVIKRKQNHEFVNFIKIIVTQK